MAEYSDKEQRTEEATPRRREEARERGQVALSSELVAAAGLVAGVAVVALAGARLAHATARGLEHGLGTLSDLGTQELTVPASAALFRESLHGVLGALALVVVPTVLACALAGFAQVGFRFAPKALEPDPSKLDPVRGLQRLLSPRGLMRTGLALAKV